MGLNFQDVIRDVHDPSNHALQISGTIQAAGQATVSLLGTPTVMVGTPTLYAVVNTSAAGVGNSIVTINPRIDYIGLMSISGNVAIGTPTVFLGTPTVYAVVNTAAAGQASIVLDNSIANIGFATVNISNPTLYAVVNTGAVGVSNSMVTINPRTDYFGLVSVSGNVAVSALPATPTGANYIGLTTVTIGSMPSVLASGQYFPTLQSVASGALAPLAVDATGELLLGNTNKYIGLTSVSGVVGLGTGTLNIGSVSVLGGAINSTLQTSTLNVGSVSILGGTINSTLQTSTLNIGSVSVLGGTINATLQTSTLNVGSVSILGGSIVNSAGPNFIGIVTIANQPALVASTVNIGSVSVLGGGIGLNAGVNNIGFATIANAVAWPDPKTFIGLATTINGAGTQFIGLVTAWTRNAGSAKTLINLPITGLSKAGSIATIAVPTNANTMYITNFVINSDATVNVRIKSGVTYMNGNASLGITLNPGGGFVMSGAPDSPSWIGLPSGAIVVEKFDMTGTIANLGGNLIYFQE